MRKIEVGRYNCPKCNADLLISTVDFCFDDRPETTTRWKCRGCREEFYSLERPYVASKEKGPHFMCPYCERDATYVALCDDWSDYWKCIPCRVSFEQSWFSEFTGVHTVNMYTNINGNLYVLRLFFRENKSRIDMLPQELEDTVMIAKEFPFLLSNVIPINVKEKLQTYLLFS